MEYARRMSVAGAGAGSSAPAFSARGAEPGRPSTENWPGVKDGSSQPSGATLRIISPGVKSMRCVTMALSSDMEAPPATWDSGWMGLVPEMGHSIPAGPGWSAGSRAGGMGAYSKNAKGVPVPFWTAFR